MSSAFLTTHPTLCLPASAPGELLGRKSHVSITRLLGKAAEKDNTAGLVVKTAVCSLGETSQQYEAKILIHRWDGMEIFVGINSMST